MKGENLDITHEPNSSVQREEKAKSRRFVGIQFACCNVYKRVYVNQEGTAYVGKCPKCSKQITMRIGEGGTDSRFFTAY